MKLCMLGSFLAFLFLYFPAINGQNCYEKESFFSIIDLTGIAYSDVPQKLSEFVDSISYIHLDDEPLIPDIWNNSVIVSEDALFIDSEQIYKYTLDGKFIQSIFQSGYGHEEAVKHIRGIYNFEKKYVTFPNHVGEYYNLYSLDGNFMGFQNRKEDEDPTDKFDVEGIKGSKTICAYLKNLQVYYYSYNASAAECNDILNPNGPVLLYAKDLTTDSVVYKLKNDHFNIKAKKQQTTMQSVNYPIDYGNIDSIFWMRPIFLDTIYRTSDFTSVCPWYVLKQRSSAADYEYKLRTMLCDTTLNNINREGVWVVYALENGILFGYATAKVSGIGYSRAGGKAKVFSEYFENDLDGFLKKVRMSGLRTSGLSTKNGYLYMLVSAEDFFEEGANPPFSDLTKNSNPVIVKLKLKR